MPCKHHKSRRKASSLRRHETGGGRTALVVFLGISICRRLWDDSAMLRWRVSIPLLHREEENMFTS